MRKCNWLLDTDHCYYETGCGKSFWLEGDLEDNKGFRFCPYCGKEILEVFPRARVDDETD